MPFPASSDFGSLTPRQMAMLIAGACLAWTAMWFLSAGNLDPYHDMLESYAWSQPLRWGTHKHPPFFAWTAGLWFAVFAQTDWTFRLLAFTNVAVGLWGVWVLGRRLGLGRLAPWGALLLLWSFPYTTLAGKFNANSQLLSLHPLVDAAVEQLALAGRLSATSCMTTAPRWREAAPRLRALRPGLSVGLHFNLTESHDGSVPARGLGATLCRAYARQWTQAALRAQWQQQLAAFEQRLGTAPDFIDGHQHVHQLPGVREALLTELQRRYAPQEMPWVRSTTPVGGLWRSPKALIIALLGGWASTRQLECAGIATNRGFGGVCGFNAPDAAAYGAHMARWMAQLGDASLLMCHPATEEVPGDAIGRQRPVEFAYLMSDAFGALLAQQRMQVAQGPLRPLLR